LSNPFRVGLVAFKVTQGGPAFGGLPWAMFYDPFGVKRLRSTINRRIAWKYRIRTPVRRYIPLLILFLVLAISSRKSDQPSASPKDVNLAWLFIESMQTDTGYVMGLKGRVQTAIDQQKVDRNALLRGSIQLLKDGQQYQRKKAATFLGQLGDQEAVGPLVEVLSDPNDSLREDACYALQWLHVNDDPAESALIRLRANDASIDVRVAAAFALGRSPDEKSIAASKEGIQGTQNAWVRQSCEEELASIGKLELPLPEIVYTEISREKYQGIIDDGIGYIVQRKSKKGNILYFEAAKRVRHAPLIFQWYRVKLD
jgi:hypothetical protein